LFFLNYSAAKKWGGVLIDIKAAMLDIAMLIAISMVIIFDDLKSNEISSACRLISIVLVLAYFSIRVLFLDRSTWKKFVKF
jgi:Kef-type K+ transport system membrane component KefB